MTHQRLSATLPRDGSQTRFPGFSFLTLLVRNRSLVYQLVRRDFEQRYVGSAVGWVWGLIHPLVLLAVYTFVFQGLLRSHLPRGEVTDKYALFLFAGMLPWLLFSETLQRSASSLIDYASLIKKSVFPAEIVPLSIYLSTLISHVLAMVLLVGAVAVWEQQVSVTLLVLPVYFVLVGMLSLGLAWIAAALHVYLRDTAQVLAVVLIVWFWLTPIFLTRRFTRTCLARNCAFCWRSIRSRTSYAAIATVFSETGCRPETTCLSSLLLRSALSSSEACFSATPSGASRCVVGRGGEQVSGRW